MSGSVVTRPMPGRFWYGVAALVVIAGVAGGVSLGISLIGGMADQLRRVVVPGDSELTLEEPGTYTIFHEKSGTFQGVVYSGSDITGLSVRLESAETGDPVALRRPTASSSYDLGGSSGVGIFAFDIAKPGRYRLSAAYDDGRTEPRAILSIASGFVTKLLTAILSILALVFGAILLAALIAIATLRSRRRAMAANAGGVSR